VNARTEAKTKRKKCRGVTCLLSSERAAFGQPSLSTSRLAQDRRAAGADDDCLCVGVDSCDGEAAGALDIHEERSGSRDKVLELVLARLSGGGWVEEINCENLSRQHHVSP